jgi:hypothetical protein
MRARVPVGVIRRRKIGATRSGLIGNSRLSSGSSKTERLSPACKLQQALRVDDDGVVIIDIG